MMEGIAFLIGFVAGISLCYYNDLKYNPYMKGYADGYEEAMIERKEDETD